jgi:hypothetical protein
MLKKYYLVIFIIIFTLPSLFAVPQQEKHYSLINISNEDLIINFKTKDISKNIRTNDYYGDYYEFLNDGITIGGIGINTRYELFTEIENQIIPFKNSFINGVVSWKFIDLIVIRDVIYFEYERDKEGNIVYEIRGVFTIPKRKNIKYSELTGKEIFDLLVDKFIIYDMFGNIIMTLDDITEDSFSTSFVEGHIEIYTEDYYNTSRYRLIGNDSNLREKPYGIFITPEIIKEGRTKYTKIEE